MKPFSIILIVSFLSGMLFLTLKIQNVKASETIYIRADGSIDPSTASIQRQGDYYTLTGNISRLEIEKSNMTFDGAGYTITGTSINDYGIVLASVSNVTVKNAAITQSAGIKLENSTGNNISANKITTNTYCCGIVLNSSSRNIISGNTVTNSYEGIWLDLSNYNSISENNLTSNGVDGIWLDQSHHNSIAENNVTRSHDDGIMLECSPNNTVSGNTVAGNSLGIRLSFSSNTTLVGNVMTDNRFNFGLEGQGLPDFVENVDTSNTVNGKPVYYWLHKQDMIVPSDAGCVMLINCTRITVRNLNLTHNQAGILLAYTTNSTITKNSATDNYDGIELSHSSNNTVSENNATNNTAGIELVYSSNNTISWNTATNNVCEGIELGTSSDNTISGNNVTANSSHGVFLDTSESNHIVGNNITNSKYGIRLFSNSKHNSISENNITANYHGVSLQVFSKYNTIFENTIATNTGNGIEVSTASGNMIYHNNFINNSQQVSIDGVGANSWDQGYPSGGNYWNSYNGADASRDGIGDSNYTIDNNNVDRYPLMGTFNSYKANSRYSVQTICNSTISGFSFNGTAITFNVSGKNGTAGFCRICIPTALMNESYTVFVNGTQVAYTLLSCSNSTHKYLYFSYVHSTEQVIIIPESPSFLILPSLTAATLLTIATIRRRKHTQKSSTSRSVNIK